MKMLIAIALTWSGQLVGQTVTAAGVLNQPLTATIVDATGTTITRTIAAGAPMQGQLVFLAPVPQTGYALVTGATEVGPTAATIVVSETSNSLSARSVTVGPTDVLCSFSASVPTAVSLEVEWQVSTLGTSMAQVQIDIGNNGTVEYLGVSPNMTHTFGQFVLGATPLVVRLTTQSTLSTGFLINRARLRVVPYTRATIQSFAQPCFLHYLTVQPAFDGTLLVSSTMNLPLQLVVVGLRATPTPLPQTLPQLCPLYPSPDAVIAMPPGGALRLPTGSLHGIPVWFQAVGFDAFVRLSESFFVFYP